MNWKPCAKAVLKNPIEICRCNAATSERGYLKNDSRFSGSPSNKRQAVRKADAVSSKSSPGTLNFAGIGKAGRVASVSLICRNQQCCLHFWLLLEDPFEQLSGIVKNVDRHGKPALFLIMPDSCLRIIQEKTKAVRRRKSVNNATISYTYIK